MNGVEAASLYVGVGVQGVPQTFQQLNEVGALVQKIGSSEATALVSANTSVATANLNKVNSEIEKYKMSHPETALALSNNAALAAIGQVKLQLLSLKEAATIKIQTITSGIGKAGQMGKIGMAASGALPGELGQLGMAGNMAGAAGLTGGMVAATAGIAGIVLAGAAALKSAGQMETFKTQLQVLLGSEQAASDRLKELTVFAQTTPFELPEVVAASKQLQVFTGEALSTGEGLRLVGDVAAGTGQPFSEVSMWFGRMYDAMKSGRPFGEATMRLQEMGAISGASREKIEKLAAGVKSGSVTMEQAWAGASKEFGRFGGMMEKQSGTFEGKLSNLMDAIGQDFAKLGALLLPIAKVAIDALIAAFTMLGQGIEAISKPIDFVVRIFQVLWTALGAGVKAVGDFVNSIGPLKTGFEVIGNVVGGVVDIAGAAVGAVGDAMGSVVGAVDRGMNDVLGISNNTGDFMATMPDNADRAANQAVENAKSAIVRGTPEVGARSMTLANELPAAVYKAGIDAGREAAMAAGKVASGIRDQRATIQGAMDQMQTDIKNSLTKTQEIALLKGQLTGKDLAAGLKSGDPVVRAQAEFTKGLIIDRLAELMGKTYNYGKNTFENYGDGIKSAYTYVVNKAGQVVNAVTGLVRASSPPVSTSPLHHIADWGYRTGVAYADSLSMGIMTAREGVTKAMGIIGSAVHNGESVVTNAVTKGIGAMLPQIVVGAPSSFASGSGSKAKGIAASGGGGLTIEINIENFYGSDSNINSLADKIASALRGNGVTVGNFG